MWPRARFTAKAGRRTAGLGLATVHGIGTPSGSHIVIDSEVGHGSRFGVCFPATGDTSTGVIARGRAPTEHIGSATVLLFADDQAVRTLVRDVLRRRGADLLVARSRAEAMTFAAEHREPTELLIAVPAHGLEPATPGYDA